MTKIEVTQPNGEGRTLALHSCSACGRHLWERDGAVLERAEVLNVVKLRVADGPAARVPRPRAPRASRARFVPPAATASPPARLAEFTIHGTPRP